MGAPLVTDPLRANFIHLEIIAEIWLLGEVASI